MKILSLMGILLALSLKSGSKYIFFSRQDADHVAGDHARTLLSHMETRASRLIFFIFADFIYKQRIVSVYDDTNVHLVKQKCGLQGFP